MIQLPAHGFTPRVYQRGYWDYMQKGGKRAVMVWPRRHGKDLTVFNQTVLQSQLRVGLYWLIYPFLNQGKKILWNGVTGGTLRADGTRSPGVKFIDYAPEALVERKIGNEMRINMRNGSIIQIMGADDPDRLVGANPVGVVFSEYSLMSEQVWKLIVPILAENDGWANFIFTPRGENHAYDLMLKAQKEKDWYCSWLTSKDCKVLTKEKLRESREALGDEALFQQEFFCSFKSPFQGAYYGPQMRAATKDQRITNVPYDTRLEVHTAWDFGYGDATSIWFYQRWGQEIRLLDYYENSGEGIEFYAKILKQKNYNYGTHFAPWDAGSGSVQTGRKLKDHARLKGIKFKVLPKEGVAHGIEAVRDLLSRCWFDYRRCDLGIKALKSYSKAWNEERQVYSNNPTHDWSSHAADAMRTLAMSFKERKKETTRQKYANRPRRVM